MRTSGAGQQCKTLPSSAAKTTQPQSSPKSKKKAARRPGRFVGVTGHPAAKHALKEERAWKALKPRVALEALKGSGIPALGLQENISSWHKH